MTPPQGVAAACSSAEAYRGVQSSIGRAEAFDLVLSAAVRAVDDIEAVSQRLDPQGDSAVRSLLDKFTAAVAASALSVMEHWPS